MALLGTGRETGFALDRTAKSLMARRLGAWVVVLWPLLLTDISRSAGSRIDVSKEAQVKAVFLFNFAQFTDWPPEAFPDKTAPIVIGIIGADPFGEFLDETVLNEVVHSRRIRVERYRSLAQARNWHIMYVGLADHDRLEQVLQSIKGKPVLTVSDMETSGRLNGIIIRFVTRQNKIRFIIDAEEARNSRLVLSSKLLHAAHEVIGPDRK